jgi:hypothetical protein
MSNWPIDRGANLSTVVEGVASAGVMSLILFFKTSRRLQCTPTSVPQTDASSANAFVAVRYRA